MKVEVADDGKLKLQRGSGNSISLMWYAPESAALVASVAAFLGARADRCGWDVYRSKWVTHNGNVSYRAVRRGAAGGLRGYDIIRRWCARDGGTLSAVMRARSTPTPRALAAAQWERVLMVRGGTA